MTLNILYGPPGSGKTTAIQSLLHEFDFSYISIGEIYRKEIEKNSVFGKELQEYVETDTEYPKHVIQRIVEPYILNAKNDEIIILDGFPKHEHELEVLELILDKLSNPVERGKVVTLTLDLQTAVDRMLRRTVCPKCDFHADKETICPRCGYEKMLRRHDDTNQEFTNRFNTFVRNNQLIAGYLNTIGFETVTIDASQDKESLRNLIKSHLFNDKASPTPHETFQQITGLKSKVISTLDHSYVSPPVRLLDSHKLLYEINKIKPVTILNWDVSQPNERTYRYDMQIDLMFIGRSKEHFIFSEGKPYAIQTPRVINFATYERKFESIVENLQATKKIDQETTNQVHENYLNLKKQVIDKMMRNDQLLPQYTKLALVNINKHLQRDNIASFIDDNYLYYYNSSLMTQWIPYCIETITGLKSIEKVFEAGVFGRRIFRLTDTQLDDAEMNTVTYLQRNKNNIVTLIREGKIIPSIELLYWSLEFAGVQHFGNDYNFFTRYSEYLGEALTNQLTSMTDDGSNYFEFKEDYGVSIDPSSGKFITKNNTSSVKRTRINSIFGLYVLLGKKMLAINDPDFRYPHQVGIDESA